MIFDPKNPPSLVMHIGEKQLWGMPWVCKTTDLVQDVCTLYCFITHILVVSVPWTKQHTARQHPITLKPYGSYTSVVKSSNGGASGKNLFTRSKARMIGTCLSSEKTSQCRNSWRSEPALNPLLSMPYEIRIWSQSHKLVLKDKIENEWLSISNAKAASK